MFEDGYQTAEPIKLAINEPQSIPNEYGLETFAKGAAVLRMLEATVSEEKFRSGLNVKI